MSISTRRETTGRVLRGLPIACTALILAAAALTGCNTSTLSVSVSPSTLTLTSPGQTAQLTATAVNQTGSSPSSSSNVTSSANWTSSVASVATVNSSGLVTAVGGGTTLITVSYAGHVANTTVTVNTGSTTTSVPTLTIIPSAGAAITTYVGEVTQFLAIGNLTAGGVQQDLTNSVRWVSSDASIASINQNGQAVTVGTGTAAGSATITAITTTSSGSTLTATTTLTTNLTSGSSSHPTLAIIPSGGQSTFPGETTQYIAIGNLGSGAAVQDLTSKVKWSSSDVSVATINQSGLATGTNYVVNVPAPGPPYPTTITAEATTLTGSISNATATLIAYGYGSPAIVSTLTMGLIDNGTAAETVNVTSSPLGINCTLAAPGGTAPFGQCSATFPFGSQVTLKANPGAVNPFRGFSANCVPVAVSPNQCVITLPTNGFVSAIFD